jgi:hypothetical protein
MGTPDYFLFADKSLGTRGDPAIEAAMLRQTVFYRLS